ncbi:hypothetical protein I4F81_010895 [Pyropia yezoensis]|uniref:Uncharacterized protein n=1 Tax=Pyropia yezoensis TaxID=2788 RepID=A0ACC3CEI9_PYRYE|nr:hypothetical protein I4F81_010895 [Neopyropia yezoensis]
MTAFVVAAWAGGVAAAVAARSRHPPGSRHGLPPPPRRRAAAGPAVRHPPRAWTASASAASAAAAAEPPAAADTAAEPADAAAGDAWGVPAPALAAALHIPLPDLLRALTPPPPPLVAAPPAPPATYHPVYRLSARPPPAPAPAPAGVGASPPPPSPKGDVAAAAAAAAAATPPHAAADGPTPPQASPRPRRLPVPPPPLPPSPTTPAGGLMSSSESARSLVLLRLPPTITLNALRAAFERWGPVVYAWLPRRTGSGALRGHATVTFADQAAADAALAAHRAARRAREVAAAAAKEAQAQAVAAAAAEAVASSGGTAAATAAAASVAGSRSSGRHGSRGVLVVPKDLFDRAAGGRAPAERGTVVEMRGLGPGQTWRGLWSALGAIDREALEGVYAESMDPDGEGEGDEQDGLWDAVGEGIPAGGVADATSRPPAGASSGAAEEEFAMLAEERALLERLLARRLVAPDARLVCFLAYTNGSEVAYATFPSRRVAEAFDAWVDRMPDGWSVDGVAGIRVRLLADNEADAYWDAAGVSICTRWNRKLGVEDGRLASALSRDPRPFPGSATSPNGDPSVGSPSSPPSSSGFSRVQPHPLGVIVSVTRIPTRLSWRALLNDLSALGPVVFLRYRAHAPACCVRYADAATAADAAAALTAGAATVGGVTVSATVLTGTAEADYWAVAVAERRAKAAAAALHGPEVRCEPKPTL